MTAHPALKATDERKRPRQSNFGALSAGLIERGRVPAAVLYGPDADAPVADSIIAVTPAPAREPMEPFEARVLRPQVPDDAAEAERLAAEERTRPLETSFGSLTEGMLERGKLPRHILTKEQIDLLLTPVKVAPEVLHQAGDATEREDDAVPAADPPVDHADAEPILVEPQADGEAVDSALSVDPLVPDHAASVETDDDAVADVPDVVADAPANVSGLGEESEPEPAPDEPELQPALEDEPELQPAGPALADAEPRSDTVDRESQAETVPSGDLEQRTTREIYDPTLPIVRHTEPAPAAAASNASALRKPATATRIVLLAASLFVVAVGGWALLRSPEPPPVAPLTAPAPAIAQIPEAVAPAPAEAAPAPADPTPAADPAPQVAPPPAAETPAVEAATDVAVAPTRQRPGAVPYDPPVVALTAPAETPVAPAPAETPSTAELPKPAPEPAPVVAAPPSVAPPAPAPTEIESTADLLLRGDDHLLRGDIATARLFYERAAEAGDVQAMLALAQTYDPQLLRKLGARGIRPEPELARHWYAKAAEAQARSGK